MQQRVCKAIKDWYDSPPSNRALQLGLQYVDEATHRARATSNTNLGPCRTRCKLESLVFLLILIFCRELERLGKRRDAC